MPTAANYTRGACCAEMHRRRSDTHAAKPTRSCICCWCLTVRHGRRNTQTQSCSPRRADARVHGHFHPFFGTCFAGTICTHWLRESTAKDVTFDLKSFWQLPWHFHWKPHVRAYHNTRKHIALQTQGSVGPSSCRVRRSILPATRTSKTGNAGERRTILAPYLSKVI